VDPPVPGVLGALEPQPTVASAIANKQCVDRMKCLMSIPPCAAPIVDRKSRECAIGESAYMSVKK